MEEKCTKGHSLEIVSSENENNNKQWWKWSELELGWNRISKEFRLSFEGTFTENYFAFSKLTQTCLLQWSAFEHFE